MPCDAATAMCITADANFQLYDAPDEHLPLLLAVEHETQHGSLILASPELSIKFPRLIPPNVDLCYLHNSRALVPTHASQDANIRQHAPATAKAIRHLHDHNTHTTHQVKAKAITHMPSTVSSPQLSSSA